MFVWMVFVNLMIWGVAYFTDERPVCHCSDIIAESSILYLMSSGSITRKARRSRGSRMIYSPENEGFEDDFLF